MMNILVRAALFVFFVLFNSQIYAQKLPEVQSSGVKLPANHRVDGKALEWTTFQAANKALNIQYTLANDQDRLYLLVKASNELMIRKMLMGGLAFGVLKDQNADNNSVHGVVITYPQYQAKPSGGLYDIPIYTQPELLKDPKKDQAKTDSFVVALNKEFGTINKTIKVLGISQVSDTIISIYNEEQIKAAGLIQNDLTYIYETSVPLKYLHLNKGSIRYFIQMNGAAFNGNQIKVIGSRHGQIAMYTDPAGVNYSPSVNHPTASVTLLLPTRIDGEYKLVE